nr:hypothetical protein [Treponema sp.]
WSDVPCFNVMIIYFSSLGNFPSGTAFESLSFSARKQKKRNSLAEFLEITDLYTSASTLPELCNFCENNSNNSMRK